MTTTRHDDRTRDQRTHGGGPAAPQKVALRARAVEFDWTGLPLVWIPREVFASHFINVLHLLLPEGERWFVKCFGEALELIDDEQLREDVVGFIGQEGMHAASHQGVLDYFDEHGLDTRPYVREIEALFRRILGDRDLTGEAKREWLIERLALVAGIEHLTAVLGSWVLNSPGLDAAGADPTMLDLLRWHGAEEVEHRAVAYDVFQHLDGRYWRRVRTYAVGGLALTWLWWRGAAYLMANDTTTTPRQRPGLLKLMRTKRKGLTPGILDLAWASWKYFLPHYHPSHEGDTAQAVAYLATSPAAVRADALADTLAGSAAETPGGSASEDLRA